MNLVKLNTTYQNETAHVYIIQERLKQLINFYESKQVLKSLTSSQVDFMLDIHMRNLQLTYGPALIITVLSTILGYDLNALNKPKVKRTRVKPSQGTPEAS